MKSLDDDRKVLMTETRTSHELILSNYKKEEEQKLNEEKRKLAADFELEVQKRKDTLVKYYVLIIFIRLILVFSIIKIGILKSENIYLKNVFIHF